MILTKELLAQMRTDKNCFTKATIEALGLQWNNLQRGWINDIIGRDFKIERIKAAIDGAKKFKSNKRTEVQSNNSHQSERINLATEAQLAHIYTLKKDLNIPDYDPEFRVHDNCNKRYAHILIEKLKILNNKATEKQIDYLVKLGVELSNAMQLTKTEASYKISELKHSQKQNDSNVPNLTSCEIRNEDIDDIFKEPERHTYSKEESDEFFKRM